MPGPTPHYPPEFKREAVKLYRFVSTLKAELVSNLQFPSRQAARTAIFDYLETFYNTRRLHSSLGYMSPADFEEGRLEESASRKVNVSALTGEFQAA